MMNVAVLQALSVLVALKIENSLLPSRQWKNIPASGCSYVFGLRVLLCKSFSGRTSLWRCAKKGHPPPSPAKASVSSFVSIDVHPGFGRLLVSLDRQTHDDYEVIIVNDGPSADVAEALKGFDRFRIIAFDASSKQAGGKKEPLAKGILAASKPWVLLTDGDCEVTGEWIETMLQSAGSKHAIIIGHGPYFAERGILNALARFDNLLIAIQYLSRAITGKPYMAVGRNLMYRKSLFQSVNGFADHGELMSGDDDLFIQQVASRTNTHATLAHQSFARSPAPYSWRELIRQKRRHVSTSPRYRWPDKWRLAGFALTHTFFWLSGMALLFSPAMPGVLLPFSIVVIVLWVSFYLCAKKLDEKHLAGWFPLVSLLYAMFLPILAILLAMGPGKKWK